MPLVEDRTKEMGEGEHKEERDSVFRSIGRSRSHGNILLLLLWRSDNLLTKQALCVW